jgi:prolyl-tRNA editing enzyme YbaK/EbsC (Cys-tRNA(Pro) deacylase)
MDDALPASAQKVQDALAAASVAAAADVRQLPVAARTAAEAAQALGCEVGAIANSLIFIADERPLLVMTSGARRSATRRPSRPSSTPTSSTMSASGRRLAPCTQSSRRRSRNCWH